MKTGSLIAVVTLSIVMTALVELHLPGLNGPWYGVVHWRRYPLSTYGLILLSCFPTVLGPWLFDRMSRCRAALLILPMLSTMAARLVYSEVHSAPGPHLAYISDAVQHPIAISYYTDAAALSNFHGWLADFPSIMPILNLHSRTKAPGMILYYMAFIKLLGPGPQTAMIAGLAPGLICTLSVPACYIFLLTIMEDQLAAFLGASFLALCPGFVLYFPASDASYVILSCSLGICWINAVRRNSTAWSIATGAIAAFILVVSFHVLIFCAFLLGHAFVLSGRPARKIVGRGAIALATCAGLCAILWFVSGYNPISTFISAWRNQQALVAQRPGERPYPTTIWNDLLDVALGTGWISFLLIAIALAKQFPMGLRDHRVRLFLLCIALPIAVAVSAVLASETARVWNFMFPLLMAPIGAILSQARVPARALILACLSLLLATICRNMSMFM